MRELTMTEVQEVSGGVAPLVIIGIDLALNGLVLGLATYAAMNHYARREQTDTGGGR